ncbi:hypothetical protein EVA_01865 [gut metagenome]|uniref:Uncharacterized protein n=1 Tax=gut metagenome TaxID=749906 RepID=J9H768_9ZZZZ
MNNIFTTQLVSLSTEVGICLFIKNQLSNAVAITQIDEGHTSHFAATLHPSSQGYFLANVFNTQFAACFRSIHNIYVYDCIINVAVKRREITNILPFQKRPAPLIPYEPLLIAFHK